MTTPHCRNEQLGRKKMGLKGRDDLCHYCGKPLASVRAPLTHHELNNLLKWAPTWPMHWTHAWHYCEVLLGRPIDPMDFLINVGGHDAPTARHMVQVCGEKLGAV